MSVFTALRPAASSRVSRHSLIVFVFVVLSYCSPQATTGGDNDDGPQMYSRFAAASSVSPALVAFGAYVVRPLE